MQKKIIILVIYTMYFSCMVCGMDEAVKTPQDTLARRNNEERITITTDDDAIQQKVPNLNLAVLPQNTRITSSSSSQRSKTPITSINELGQEVQRAKSTHLTSNTQRITRRKQRIQSEDVQQRPSVAVASVSNDQILQQNVSFAQKRQSLLPKAIVQSLVSYPLGDETYYSEEQVWAMLQSFNYGLYEFGKTHKLDLEQLIDISQLADNFDIDPQVLVDVAHKNVSDKNSTSRIQQLFDLIPGTANDKKEFLIKGYEDIKAKNPEAFKQLVLEAIKAAGDQVDGQPNRSALADAHIGMQNDKIDDQQTTIRQQWLGIVVSIVTAIGGWVLGGFQTVQSNGQSSNCTCPMLNNTNATT